ncbi:MAG: YebC/PmpR family DNA-binding transcriptional regulator [Candidatus Dadabacteria bacterium]|nr:MAG: YebC/PmpR family DNA-binding transcriptional regulator [Candidatus Dadabacteria bacterium]
MAGHNKWSKIKHKKAKEDKKKGKVFTRLGREIQVAAREGGPDPQYNAALRQAVDRAMAENMPNENIQRAIKRGAGLLDGQEIEEIWYEGYGPAGVAVMVYCLTDNRNRTVSELRHAFSKAGGSLGESGSVAWNFNRVGVITVRDDRDEDAMTELAIEAGAEDVRPGEEDGTWELVTADSDLGAVRQKVIDAGAEVVDAGLRYEASNEIEVSGKEAQQVIRFLDAVENLDDVQEVYDNCAIDDEELERIAEAM